MAKIRAIYLHRSNRYLTSFVGVTFRVVPNREINWSRLADLRIIGIMAKQDATNKLAWPWWGPWALLGVVVTSLLTIAATLNDIL